MDQHNHRSMSVWAAGVADLDGDGRLDVVTSDCGMAGRGCLADEFALDVLELRQDGFTAFVDDRAR
jgi:hypothetical protein